MFVEFATVDDTVQRGKGCFEPFAGLQCTEEVNAVSMGVPRSLTLVVTEKWQDV